MRGVTLSGRRTHAVSHAAVVAAHAAATAATAAATTATDATNAATAAAAAAGTAATSAATTAATTAVTAAAITATAPATAAADDATTAATAAAANAKATAAKARVAKANAEAALANSIARTAVAHRSAAVARAAANAALANGSGETALTSGDGVGVLMPCAQGFIDGMARPLMLAASFTVLRTHGGQGKILVPAYIHAEASLTHEGQCGSLVPPYTRGSVTLYLSPSLSMSISLTHHALAFSFAHTHHFANPRTLSYTHPVTWRTWISALNEGGFPRLTTGFLISAGRVLRASTRQTLNLHLLIRASVHVFTLKVSHALISVQRLVSMTLVLGAAAHGSVCRGLRRRGVLVRGTAGQGGVENMHSTDVESPPSPPPPRGHGLYERSP